LRRGSEKEEPHKKKRKKGGLQTRRNEPGFSFEERCERESEIGELTTTKQKKEKKTRTKKDKKNHKSLNEIDIFCIMSHISFAFELIKEEGVTFKDKSLYNHVPSPEPRFAFCHLRRRKSFRRMFWGRTILSFQSFPPNQKNSPKKKGKKREGRSMKGNLVCGGKIPEVSRAMLTLQVKLPRGKKKGGSGGTALCHSTLGGTEIRGVPF